MTQIRLNRTREIDEVLAFLRSKYRVLSEAEIIKVALAEKYKKEVETTSHEDLEAFDFKPLSQVKKGFLDSGYSATEVNDMVEALSELPQYASTTFNKSK